MKKRCYSEDELISMPMDDLDRMAFGVTTGDIISIKPENLFIAYPCDLEKPQSAYHLKGRAWLESMCFDVPVSISIDEKGRRVLEDGHHRYFAAKLLGRSLQACVEVKGNPVRVILARQQRHAHEDAEPGL